MKMQISIDSLRGAASRWIAVGALLIAAPLLSACGDSTAPGEPALAKLIVFTAIPEDASDPWGTDIFTVRADGTDLRQLTTGARAVSPAWSGDGQLIAYYGDRAGDGATWIMNADGSDPRAVTAPHRGGHPTWKPSGRTLAFTRSDSLYTLDVTTGERTMILACGEIRCVWPQWSPDGSRIAFVGRNLDYPFTGFTRTAVYVLALDGSAPVLLDSGFPDAMLVGWSHDGERIAFIGSASDVTPSGVYTLQPGSATPTLLSPQATTFHWVDDFRLLRDLTDHPEEGDAGGIYFEDIASGTTTLVVALPQRLVGVGPKLQP